MGADELLKPISTIENRTKCRRCGVGGRGFAAARNGKGFNSRLV